MLVMQGTNISFNGVSQDESGVQNAQMSASYSGDNVYFSLTVVKNTEEVDVDFAEFKEKVLTSVESMA